MSSSDEVILREAACQVTVKRPSGTRSSSDVMLTRKQSRTKFGDRAFSTCGPHLWNALPRHVRGSESIFTFKCVLKSWLFEEAFRAGEIAP